jgi:hypothetical protein
MVSFHMRQRKLWEHQGLNEDNPGQFFVLE